MSRFAAFLYGIICYVIFFVTFLYAIAFIGGFLVPKTISSGTQGSVLLALIIDACLMGLFAVQHSVMARQWFKRAWTKIIPKPIERSTYVLFSSLVLILLFWQWRPLKVVIWNVQAGPGYFILWGLFVIGWFIVLFDTFLINHFHLFGLQQVYLNFKNRELVSPKFVKPMFYKIVRHPLMLGFIIAFWAAPYMTAGHLLFSIATTGYILIAIQLEERDLVRLHGNDYIRYQQEVSQIIPMPPKREITKEAMESN